MLQTLALFEPELEDAASRVSDHAENCEEEVLRLWEAFEDTCLRNNDCGVTAGEGGLPGGGGSKVERGTVRVGGGVLAEEDRAKGEVEVEGGGCYGGASKDSGGVARVGLRKPWVD